MGVGMTIEESRQIITRGLMVLIVAGLIVYGVFSVRSFMAPSVGSSQRETLRIACLACGAETVLSASQCNEIAGDPQTGAMKCPKCGAFRAFSALLTCPKCHRAVPRAPELMAGDFVCPWCKASLNEPPPNP